MALVPVSSEMAIEVGSIHARRYHRQHAAISLADCIAAAPRRSAAAFHRRHGVRRSPFSESGQDPLPALSQVAHNI
jgi:hypothetical protein